MSDNPSGTVTFLFTDIQGSTRGWDTDVAAMNAAHARHDAILRDTITSNQGFPFKTVGDAFQAAFHNASDALQAAIDAQRRFAHAPDDRGLPLRVRMALHTGAAQLQDGDYIGAGLVRAPSLNRLARILATGYGGQILLSLATQQLVRDSLPSSIGLRDLGTHRLRDLQQPERIFQVIIHDDLDVQADFPALKTLDSRPNNLPVQPTEFIGREREAAGLQELLRSDSVRQITLTGPGGIGKTRVALHVAAMEQDLFEDGVFLVQLDAVQAKFGDDPDLLFSIICQELGILPARDSSPRAALIEELRPKRLLLLLDNFEHLLSMAPSVADLLARCPSLKIMITSRTPVHIRAEREFPVPAFDVPDIEHPPPLQNLLGYGAVRFFVDRAKAVRPSFTVTAENGQAVAEICARLDGLPLALELAAARIKLFQPQALLTRLSRSLDLLTGGAREVPSRLQTLRNTIAWSYDLLDPEEQRLFRQLSVFIGGATLEAIDLISSDDAARSRLDLDRLASLVDHSLVVMDSNQSGLADEEPRVSMLRTIREFGEELLVANKEEDTVRRVHARHFLDLAEQSRERLTGAMQGWWLLCLEAEYGNIQAALNWALDDGDFPSVLRAGGALRHFWERTGRLEQGRSWLERAVALGGTEATAERARALTDLANMALDQNVYHQARSLYTTCLTIWRQMNNEHGIAATLNNLGRVAIMQGDYVEAEKSLEQSLTLFETLGHRLGVAFARDNLGDVYRAQGRLGPAQGLYERTLDDLMQLGDSSSLAYSYHRLGTIAVQQGEVSRASEYLEQSVNLFRTSGDRLGEAVAIFGFAELAAQQGDTALAEARYREALALSAPLSDRLGMIQGLERISQLIVARSPDQALRLLAAAHYSRDVLGAPPLPSENEALIETRRIAQEVLGNEASENIWIGAKTVALDDLVADVLALS